MKGSKIRQAKELSTIIISQRGDLFKKKSTASLRRGEMLSDNKKSDFLSMLLCKQFGSSRNMRNHLHLNQNPGCIMKQANQQENSAENVKTELLEEMFKFNMWNVFGFIQWK
jgi:hypothetical protein